MDRVSREADPAAESSTELVSDVIGVDPESVATNEVRHGQAKAGHRHLA